MRALPVIQSFKPVTSLWVLVCATILASCTTPKVATPTAAQVTARANAAAGATPTAVADAATAIVAARAAGIAPPPAPGEPRRYEDVVTKDAKTSRGMLLYHKVKERHYFELPQRLLGRDLLWSAEIAQASSGAGFNGLSLGYKVVRFERVDNRILMRGVSYLRRGTSDLKAATDAVELSPILFAFNIEAEGNERSADLRSEEKKAAAEKAKELAKEKETLGDASGKNTINNTPDKATEKKIEGKIITDGVISAAALTTPLPSLLASSSTPTSAATPSAPPAPATASAVEGESKMEEMRKAADVAITISKLNKTESVVENKDDANPAKDAKPKAPKEKWPVIEVTRLLLTNSSDLLDSRSMGSSGLSATDPSRSLINQVKVFPQNVEVRSTLTFASFPAPAMPTPGQPTAPQVPRNPSRSAIIHYSLAELPETPMQGRYADQRVGYYTEAFQEFGGERSGVRDREFITRYRLEKRDPAAAVSEPIKPITYYIASEVPEKWRKYLKQGVEDWQPAFEKAGFKRAIIARDAPTKAEDPDWDAEDARYSVIRWVALPVQNAMGPHVNDPRSGEVISAHVVFWHDILKLMEQLYFVQAGTADKRVNTLPLSDELIGELLRYVAAHEVGHTLGLRHNHRASSAYSVKQLRDPAFTNAHGTVASIMAYGRFNSVAQPSDGVTSFVPKIGPYDDFAIEWGYKPLNDGALNRKTAEAEITELDLMAARQIAEPLLRFGGEDMAATFDPEVLTENIGRERIEATKLSMASLERAAARLIPATTRLGEDYTTLQSTYRMLISQRFNYLSSVVKQIGGVRENRFLGGRGGDSFTRTTPKEQKAAIRYLLDDALNTPKWLTDPAVLNRIRVFDVAAPVITTQNQILTSMMSPLRFRLLEDAEMVKHGSGMEANQYLATIQSGVFRELKTNKPVVDVYRRELQRAYIEQLKGFSGETQRINNANAAQAFMYSDISIDLRPAAIQSLKDLKRDLNNARPNVSDQPTRLHIAQLDREITQILKIRGD
jgi:Met-zincin/Domain of unknown function (DUF5117)/Domain of unknown function (DUF5118)